MWRVELTGFFTGVCRKHTDKIFIDKTYEIDADLKEDDDGYTAFLYMNYASYNGYINRLLGLIFILSDDFSVFEAKDNRDSDLLMCFTYHTHNVYLKDLEITDFE